MLSKAILAGVVGTAAARTLWTDLETKSYTYSDWLAEFGSRHPGSEDIFNENLASILAHNANPINTWKAGVNQVCSSIGGQVVCGLMGSGSIVVSN